MTGADRAVGKGGRIDRRTILRGVAAAGLFGATGVASATGQHEITFVAPEDANAFRYEFSVTGAVESGGNTDGGDVISGSTVTGAVGEGRKDTFRFTGELATLGVEGAGTVTVDGEVIQESTIDQQQVSGDTTQADTGGGAGLPNLVVVSTPNTDEFVQYAFEVTGDLDYLEPDEDSPPDQVIDAGDRVRVEGGISTGDDRYAFSGDLVETDVPSEVNLSISAR